jgi:hypothetical protein
MPERSRMPGKVRTALPASGSRVGIKIAGLAAAATLRKPVTILPDALGALEADPQALSCHEECLSQRTLPLLRLPLLGPPLVGLTPFARNLRPTVGFIVHKCPPKTGLYVG